MYLIREPANPSTIVDHFLHDQQVKSMHDWTLPQLLSVVIVVYNLFVSFSNE